MKVRITRTNYVTRADSRGNGNARLRLPMSAAWLYIDMKEGTKKRDGSFTPLVQSGMYSQLAYTYRSACQIQLIWPNLNHSRQSGLSSSSPTCDFPLAAFAFSSFNIPHNQFCTLQSTSHHNIPVCLIYCFIVSLHFGTQCLLVSFTHKLIVCNSVPWVESKDIAHS